MISFGVRVRKLESVMLTNRIHPPPPDFLMESTSLLIDAAPVHLFDQQYHTIQ